MVNIPFRSASWSTLSPPESNHLLLVTHSTLQQFHQNRRQLFELSSWQANRQRQNITSLAEVKSLQSWVVISCRHLSVDVLWLEWVCNWRCVWVDQADCWHLRSSCTCWRYVFARLWCTAPRRPAPFLGHGQNRCLLRHRHERVLTTVPWTVRRLGHNFSSSLTLYLL